MVKSILHNINKLNKILGNLEALVRKLATPFKIEICKKQLVFLPAGCLLCRQLQ